MLFSSTELFGKIIHFAVLLLPSTMPFITSSVMNLFIWKGCLGFLTVQD